MYIHERGRLGGHTARPHPPVNIFNTFELHIHIYIYIYVYIYIYRTQISSRHRMATRRVIEPSFRRPTCRNLPRKNNNNYMRS